MRRGYRGTHKGSTVKARIKNAPRAVLNSVLTVVLVVGLAPSVSFAGQETVTVRDNEGELAGQVVEQQAFVSEQAAPTTKKQEEPLTGPAASDSSTDADVYLVSNLQKEMARVSLATTVPAEGAVNMGAADAGDNDAKIDVSFASAVEQSVDASNYYFNDSVDVTVKITDADFQSGAVAAKKGGNEKARETGFTGTGDEKTATLTLNKDNIGTDAVTIVVTATDTNGDSKEYVCGETLTNCSAKVGTDDYASGKGVKLNYAPVVSISWAANPAGSSTLSSDRVVFDSAVETSLVATITVIDATLPLDYSDSNNSGKCIITQTGASDKQATMSGVDNAWTKTSETEYTKDITFTCEGSKEGGLQVTATDAGGITSDSAAGGRSMVADDAAPTVKIEWTGGGESVSDNGATYYGAERVATVTVEDAVGFSKAVADTAVSAVGYSSATATATPTEGDTVTKMVYTYTFGKNVIDGNCSLSVAEIKDLSGRSATMTKGESDTGTIADAAYSSGDFKMLVKPILETAITGDRKAVLDDVDKSAVYGSLSVTYTVKDLTWTTDKASVTYTGSNAPTLSWLPADDAAVIHTAAVSLGADNDSITYKDLAIGGGSIAFQKKTDDEVETYVDVTPDDLKLTVPNGDSTTTSSIIVDKKAPTLKVTWNTSDPAQKVDEIPYYNTERVATIVIEDEAGLDETTLGGLTSDATYTGGTPTVVDTDSTETEKSEQTNGLYTKYVVKVTYSENTATDTTCALVIPKGVKDAAGNELTCSDNEHFAQGEYAADGFKMLVTPTVSISSTDAVKDKTVDSKSLYKDSRTVIYTVTTASWDDDNKPKVTVDASGETGKELDVSWSPESKQEGTVTYVGTVLINKSGTYENLKFDWGSTNFLVEGTEEAAAASYTEAAGFVVDADAPRISVDWNPATPTKTYQGDSLYEVERVATIVIEDETGLDNDALGALAATGFKGGVFALVDSDSTEGPKSEKSTDDLYTKYVAKVTYGANHYADACTFELPTVNDVAGHSMASDDADYVDSTNTYKSDGFRMLVNPVLTVKSVTPVVAELSDVSYYKAPLTVTWSLLAASQAQVDALSVAAPEATVDETWVVDSTVTNEDEGAGIAYTRAVVFSNSAELTNAITVSSSTLQFVKPASSSQGNPSDPEELDTSYTFVPADFTVDAISPKLNLVLAPAENVKMNGSVSPAPVSPESGTTLYFDGTVTATMSIDEANPLNAGNIVADFGRSNDGTDKYDFSAGFTPAGREYADDGEYTVLVSGNGESDAARDLVGNLLASGTVDVPASAIYSMTIIVDKVKPVVTAQYVNDEGNPVPVFDKDGNSTSAVITGTGATYYCKGDAVKLRVFVDEAHFDATKTTVNGVSYESSQWTLVDDSATKRYVDVDVASADNPSEGNDSAPEVVVASQDLAGNQADSFTVTTVADKKAPSVTVRYYTDYDGDKNPVEKNIDDTYYADDTVTAEITVTERYFNTSDGSGDTCTSIAPDPAGEISSAWQDKGDGVYVRTCTFAGADNEEATFKLGLTARDMAGNSTEYATDIIVVDMKAPVIESVDFYKGDSTETFDKNADGAYYSNEDVKVKIVIDETYLDRAATEDRILVNGQSVSKTVEWTDPNTAVFTLAVPDDPTSYEISAQAVDRAKPESNVSDVETRTLRLDKERPKLTVTLPDGVSIENETETTEIRHYAGSGVGNSIVATVVVSDPYVDPEDIAIDVPAGVTKVLDESDSTNPTWTITFPAPEADSEAEYALSVSGHDKANNKIESGDAKTFVSKEQEQQEPKYKTTVVIDDKAPELKVDWDNNSVQNGFYYRAARKATITVTETYFDPTRITVDGVATTAENWVSSGDKHTYNVEKSYNEGQAHQLVVAGKDFSDNYLTGDDNASANANHHDVDATMGVYDSGVFVVDTHNPEIIFTVSQARTNTFGDVDYFRLGDQLNIQVSVDDINFKPKDDADKTRTTITPTGTNTASYSLDSWIGTDDGANYTVTFSPNDAYGAAAANTLTATVYDLAGNSATFTYGDASSAAGRAVDSVGTLLSGNSRFALDVHAPSITQGNGANIPDREIDNNYGDTLIFYKSATTLGIVVTDALGIERITGTGSDYTFTAVAGVAGGKEWVMEVALRNGVEFTDAFELTATDVAHNVHRWKINPATLDVDDISTDAENTPIYGNLPNLYPKALILDTTFPELSLTDLGNNTYYNYPQTVTLNIAELNFRYLVDYNGTQTVLTTDAEPGGNGTPQSPTARVSDMSSIDELAGRYTYSTTFSADGHYIVHAEVTDPAGNRTAIQTNRFTIDQTAPTIDVSFDNNSATNGNYYAAGRTATIVVTEHNFDAALINITTNGSVGGWSHDGDRHVITVGFGSDGTYNLSVSGRDLAGNTFPTYTADQFIVDMTAPSITISFLGGDSESQRAFNNVVQPVISFSDEANYDANGANFTIRGNKTGEVTYSFDRSSDGNGETVTYADFEHVIGVDDIYTITASLTDMAGNQAAEATETFSVNRFGSNYIIVSPTARGADSSDLGYLDEAPEIVVQEINVVGVEESSVAVTYNLKTTNLERQTASGRAGYTVQDLSSTAAYGWQQYEYTIARESFVGETGGESPDGNYVVVLSSHDATGNTNSSANFWVDKNDTRANAEGDADATETEKRMSAAVKFTLDTTPPDILGLSVSNHETVNASGEQEVSFTATDNIGFDEESGIVVLVDGEEVTHTAASDGSGKVTFFVPEKPFTEQQIEITVADFATNERTLGKANNPDDLTGSFAVKVSSNFLDLYLPFVVAGIVVVVGAAIAAFVVARRRAGKN